MSCLGVHFAVSDEDLQRIVGAPDDDALLELIQEDIEERYLKDDDWSFQTDKAWDAIHRVLTDGELEIDTGPIPLRYCILGGQPLYSTDDYIVSLVDSSQVKEVAAALRSIEKAWFRERYLTLDETDYAGKVGDEDFEYTWANFEGLPAFFERAARANRAVVFTADQ